MNINKKLSNYDSKLIYLGGYKNCYSTIKCKCLRCGNTFERKWTNIARHNTEYSCPICQTKKGLEKSKQKLATAKPYIEPVKDREQHFIERLLEKNMTIKYISGYENSEKPVLLECSICGYRFSRKAQIVRGNNIPTCPKCDERNRQLIIKTRKRLRQEQKEYIRLQEINRKEVIKKIKNKIKRNTVHICIKCNKEFVENTTSYRCANCRKKRKHSNKSLLKLYERDKGICYLCNGICNWNDKKIVNGTTIVGNTYPSIDHIIPLAKGGTDDWNNLKLAHRICNALKRDIF